MGDTQTSERERESSPITVGDAPAGGIILPVSKNSGGSEPRPIEPTISVAKSARGGVPPVGLGVVGVLTLLFGIWASVVPFVGPSFGFSADGTTSWYWDLAHAILWVLPGVFAVAVGLFMVGLLPRAFAGRARFGSAVTGLVLAACGAWLVLGPLAWPVMERSAGVFVPASPIREFTYQVGYSSGPGLVLAMLGAFAMSWAVRSRRSA